MAKRLQALAELAENPGLVPNTHTHVSSNVPNALFCLQRHFTYVMYIQACGQKTQTDKSKNK